MLIRKAFKFRLYPNKSQQAVLAVQFGHTRFVYNHFLAARKEQYAQTGLGLSYQDNARMLVEMKRNPETAWLKEADSQALQQSLKDLERAYKNCFEKRAGSPRFKSRHRKQS